jgi:hypothetical protein
MTETDEQAKDEGMSTTKKVVAGAAVGVAVPAAVGVAKKLMDSSSGDDGDTQQSAGRRQGTRSASRGTSNKSKSRGTSSKSRSASSSSRRRTSSTAASRSKRSSSSGSQSGGGGRTRTKEQLYATAKRLKIEGRSRMTKAQLERAVARAR